MCDRTTALSCKMQGPPRNMQTVAKELISLEWIKVAQGKDLHSEHTDGTKNALLNHRLPEEYATFGKGTICVLVGQRHDIFPVLFFLALFYFGSAARADKNHHARCGPSVIQSENWHRIQTANFQIFYKKEPTLAHEVSQWSEEARKQIQDKWIGTLPKEIRTASAKSSFTMILITFSLSTGYDASSYGASQMEIGNGTVHCVASVPGSMSLRICSLFSDMNLLTSY